MPGEPIAPPGQQELIDWWVATAKADAELTIPKAIEYSAHDLVAMGVGLLGANAPDQRRTEAAIAFYASGKAARLVGSYVEGREPSNDSWLDLSIYSMMGRRTREVGSWPGTTLLG